MVPTRGGVWSLNHRLAVAVDEPPPLHLLVTGRSTLYGPDGSAIARDRGQVRFEVVVDYGGTPTDLSDDVELSLTLTRARPVDPTTIARRS